MFDLRTLENPLLFWMFEKRYPDVDPSSIVRTMEYSEAVGHFMKFYSHKMRQEPKEGVHFSVNMGYDLANKKLNECAYCGKISECMRCTKKYCSDSHRILAYRKRRSSHRLAIPRPRITKGPLFYFDTQPWSDKRDLAEDLIASIAEMAASKVEPIRVLLAYGK